MGIGGRLGHGGESTGRAACRDKAALSTNCLCWKAWADPQMRRSGEINNEHGGRSVYFKDPSGYAIELITRPYLSRGPDGRVRGRVDHPAPRSNDVPAYGYLVK